MLSTDKTFDILPHIVDVYEKLDLYKYYEEKRKEYKKNPVTQWQAGEELFKFIFKNAVKVKTEIFNIAAIVSEKPVEEIAKQNIVKTVMDLKELFVDKETMDFFKQAVQ